MKNAFRALLHAALTSSLLVFGPVETVAQTRTASSWGRFQPPPREVTVSISAWSLMNQVPGRSLGGMFTRNLTDDLAVEADLAIAGAEGQPFGVGTVQVRASRGTDRVGFITLGVAYGVASRQHPNAPRDDGFSLGGGALLPFTDAAALRVDAKLMLFRRNYGAIQLTAGLTIGLR